MIPWEEIDRAPVPGPGHDGEVVLLRRDREYSIRTAGTELMNSRRHGSEDALAQLAHARMTRTSGLRILVGGLGMGYTLAAALARTSPDAGITVAELIPAVVRWNRDTLGHLAGRPLDDPRVTVEEGDVMEIIQKAHAIWDEILLDVDNGPDGLTRKTNDRLYSPAGLRSSFLALRPGGVLAVWSSGPDPGFTDRLIECGFRTRVETVRAHRPGKGSRHTIWIAVKP